MTALERFKPSLRGQLAYEHIHRYASVLDLVAGCKVLDLACGEGYGSALIATKAAEVIGVDIDAATVTRAGQVYSEHRNLSFIDADVADLPFGPSEFDLVVSFETIEHVEHQAQMLDEIARVLKPSGRLVISTPNKSIYSGPDRMANPFHVKELDLKSFLTLLGANFAHTEIYGQRFYIGSVLAPFGTDSHSRERTEFAGFSRREGRGLVVERATPVARDPEYLIAVCSREVLPRRKHQSSIYIDPADDLWLQQEKLLRWASRLHEEDELLRARVVSVGCELEEATGQLQAERRRSEVLTQQLDQSRKLVELLETDARATMVSFAASTERSTKASEYALSLGSSLELAKSNADAALRRLEERTQAFVESEQMLVLDLAACNQSLRDVTAHAAALEIALAGEKARHQFVAAALREERENFQFDIARRDEQAQAMKTRAAELETELNTMLSTERTRRGCAEAELSTEREWAAREIARRSEQIQALTVRAAELDADLVGARAHRDRLESELAESRLRLQQEIAAHGVILRLLEARLADEKVRPEAAEVGHRGDVAKTNKTATQSSKVQHVNGSAAAHPLGIGDAAAADQVQISSTNGRPWLPGDLVDFWISQNLRDHLVEQHGEDAVAPIEYLMALVSHFDSGKNDIIASPMGRALIDRIVRLSAQTRQVEAPDVTIVIPVYNGLIYTLTAILSILQTPSRYSYEILIGDDCSTDATEAVLSGIGGCVRHFRNTKNKGFLGNCNATAGQARGRYIVLLNSDVITLPGWLDELIGTFSSARNVGLVGSKLINGDGSLQEAGGIFWNDGSAWNFGRNQNPRLPQFNYLKDVDYCSGAAIALPAELWLALRGFDRIYTPAYCEDSDIAFRVRAVGLRCVYQPHSEVIHHEGKSHGSDTSVGVKAFQVLNQQKFAARWRHVLARDHFPNGENVFVARDRSRNKPHVLFIDHYVPQWDRDAGSRTMYHYMKLMADRGFQVVLWPDNLYKDIIYVKQLQQLGVEVIYSESYEGRFQQWFSESRRWIRYAFCSRPQITQRYLDFLRTSPNTKILYYGHDLHWKRLLSQHEVTKEAKLLSDSAAMKQLEHDVCDAAHVVLYPSKEECDYVRSSFGSQKEVVELPMAIFTSDELDSARRHIKSIASGTSTSIVFVGGFNHTPNKDAVKWFLDEVMPLVRKKNSEICLKIVGSNLPEDWRALASADVEMVGQVDDRTLDAIYATCAATLVPLRYGAGVKGKTIAAFARGVPVVSTSVGLQGIDGGDEVAFRADTASDFAAAIVLSVEDRSAAAQRAMNALTFVSEHYSEVAAARRLGSQMPELVDHGMSTGSRVGHAEGANA